MDLFQADFTVCFFFLRIADLWGLKVGKLTFTKANVNMGTLGSFYSQEKNPSRKGQTTYMKFQVCNILQKNSPLPISGIQLD